MTNELDILIQREINCIYCGMTDNTICYFDKHICVWCRTPITKEDNYRIYRYGQPHCDYQQQQKEKPFIVILGPITKEVTRY